MPVIIGYYLRTFRERYRTDQIVMIQSGFLEHFSRAKVSVEIFSEIGNIPVKKLNSLPRYTKYSIETNFLIFLTELDEIRKFKYWFQIFAWLSSLRSKLDMLKYGSLKTSYTLGSKMSVIRILDEYGNTPMDSE